MSWLRFLLLPLLAVLIVLGTGLYAWAHALQVPLLSTAGPVAAGERYVLLLTFGLSGLVVIPVFFLLFFFAWRYRSTGPRAYVKHQPNWDHDNAVAEALWWLAPAAIIFVLALLAVHSSRTLDPYRPLMDAASAPGASAVQAPLEVEVVALDWKWLFIYPQQGIATVNELVIPAGRPVHFDLTADAPMNSFWIPALGGQIMVMPGMNTQLNLLASKAGTYDGASANISGRGFASMAFKTQALAPADFAAWVAAAKQGNDPLDATTYAALAAPSESVPPRAYSAVSPALYTAIMANVMWPGRMTIPSPALLPASTTGTSTGTSTAPAAMPSSSSLRMRMHP